MSTDLKDLLGQRAGKALIALFVAALAVCAPQLAFADDELTTDQAAAVVLADSEGEPISEDSDGTLNDETSEGDDQTGDSDSMGADPTSPDAPESPDPEPGSESEESESAEGTGDDASSAIIAIDLDAVAGPAAGADEASVEQAELADAKQAEPEAAFAKAADEQTIDVERADDEPVSTPATAAPNANPTSSAPATAPIVEAAEQYQSANEPVAETIAAPTPLAQRGRDELPAPVGDPLAPSESEITQQLTQAPAASKHFAVEPSSSPPTTSKQAHTAVERNIGDAPSRANGPTRCRSPSRD